MFHTGKHKTFNLALFLLGLLLPVLNYSQNIKIEGKVYDEYLNAINASLLIKKSSSPNVISEYYLIRNGVISYRLKKVYRDSITLEIIAPGYKFYKKVININNSNINLDAQLFKSKITELKEVVVKGRKRPFKIKKDTVVFNVEAYKDGTERKIEDLLRKLPGIEINNKTGNIMYNGRYIETVMLEGDNLFGYNYTLGTKNINVDIVQSVEAIENYSENKLLKGIENSEKVAINLKLKSDKIDFSGSMDINGGYSDNKTLKSHSSVNFLGINKVFKSFGGLSFNNVGENISPLTYTSGSDNLEAIREMNYMARKIIPNIIIPESIDENRTNINNQFFSNYNSLFNWGKSNELPRGRAIEVSSGKNLFLV